MSETADPGDSILTLAGPASAELKVQRSRFLARTAPAGDEQAARAVVAAMTRQYHDCRHVCYAWRLGREPAVAEIRNDAGEPSGTAGGPILKAIRQAGLTDCVTVVARYFGGVKLGTGGLSRAYGDAARAALDGAPRRTVLLGHDFVCRFPYSLQKTVAHLLAAHDGRTTNENYAQDIEWEIWLPNSRWPAFAAALREATAGAVTIAPLDETT